MKENVFYWTWLHVALIVLGRAHTKVSIDSDMERLFKQQLQGHITMDQFSFDVQKYLVFSYHFDFTNGQFFFVSDTGERGGRCTINVRRATPLSLFCSFSLSKSFALYNVEGRMKFPWKRYHFIANATILKGALYASIPLNYSSYADKQGVLCSADVTTLSISTYFRSLSVVKPVEQKFLKQARPLVSMQIQHELERSCKLSAARVKEIWQNHRGIISTEAPGITTSVKDPEDEDKVSPVDQASLHTPSTTPSKTPSTTLSPTSRTTSSFMPNTTTSTASSSTSSTTLSTTSSTTSSPSSGTSTSVSSSTMTSTTQTTEKETTDMTQSTKDMDDGNSTTSPTLDSC
ncbi:uncharacterized protein LOC142814530 isoform X2 [Rhipicephalus microplus]